MRVVSNSSPLIALEQIQQLDLLQSLFTEILIPDQVAAETVASVQPRSWIHIRSGLRSKIKTLMLLGDSTQTPSIRLRVVFLNQLASPALVFHSNLSSNEMATPANP